MIPSEETAMSDILRHELSAEADLTDEALDRADARDCLSVSNTV
jgi:hypothetical protein